MHPHPQTSVSRRRSAIETGDARMSIARRRRAYGSGRTQARTVVRTVVFVLVLFTAAHLVQVYVSIAWGGGAGDGRWWDPAFMALGRLGLVAASTPALVWLALRLPVRRRTWLNLLPHLGAATVMGFAYTAWIYFQHRILGTAGVDFASVVADCFDEALLFYIATVSVAQLISAERETLHQQLTASELRSKLSDAQLRALRYQLQPHFLFNAINGISALIRHGDASRARRMLTELASLLRSILSSDTADEIPLRKDLENLAHYIRLERLRHGDRLDVRMSIPSQVQDAMVPALVLQTLVENAFKHAFSDGQDRVVVEISSDLQEGTLLLRVSDSGAGIRGPLRHGVGFTNTIDRLRMLYGEGATLTTASPPQGGFVATVSLPLVVARPSAAEIDGSRAPAARAVAVASGRPT